MPLPIVNCYQNESSAMINVVAFLIENFSDLQTCPDGDDLGMMLEGAGFDDDEIGNALLMLQLLHEESESDTARLQQSRAFRVYTSEETDALDTDIRALLHFLEQTGALNPLQREFVIHALMHLQPDDVTLENAKLLALLVLWAHRSELPVLIGDELMAVLHGKGVMQ